MLYYFIYLAAAETLGYGEKAAEARRTVGGLRNEGFHGGTPLRAASDYEQGEHEVSLGKGGGLSGTAQGLQHIGLMKPGAQAVATEIGTQQHLRPEALGHIGLRDAEIAVVIEVVEGGNVLTGRAERRVGG